MLVYDPPHIDGLDKALMEFSNSKNYTYIEFNKGGEGEMTLEELLAALGVLNSADRLRVVLAALDGLDVAEIDLQPAFTKLWELDDQNGISTNWLRKVISLRKQQSSLKHELLNWLRH